MDVKLGTSTLTRYVTDRGMWYVCMYVCIFTFYFALFVDVSRNDYMEDRGVGCVDWVWSSIGRRGQYIGRCGQVLGGVVKYEEVLSRYCGLISNTVAGLSVVQKLVVTFEFFFSKTCNIV